MERELGAILKDLPLSTCIMAARDEPVPGDDDGMEPPRKAVVVVRFSEPGLGFGEVTIKQVGNRLFLDSEHMGKDKVKALLGRLIDAAVDDLEQGPAKHAAWKDAFGATCGPGCRACGGR